MRLILEVFDRYFQLETGEIIEPVELEEAEEVEAPEFIRLPLGFQAPPPVDEERADDDDDETPEADCGRGARG